MAGGRISSAQQDIPDSEASGRNRQAQGPYRRGGEWDFSSLNDHARPTRCAFAKSRPNEAKSISGFVVHRDEFIGTMPIKIAASLAGCAALDPVLRDLRLGAGAASA